VLAVDGGASKVDVALVAIDGTVVRAVRRRGRYNFGLGSNGSMEGLARAITAAQGSATDAVPAPCSRNRSPRGSGWPDRRR
jgi:N-acetylglucosamine kinase-like BadF-type ATPase